MHKLGWRASDTRELVVPRLRRPGGEPARRARPRVPPVPRDPRRRPHLRRGDGRRPRAGRVRPRVRVREGAAAVRQADLEVPGGAVPARRHGDRDRGRPRARPPRGVAQGRRASRSRSRRRRRSSTPGLLSNRAANAALQIHGGYGFMDEFAISRLYRDQKILEIGEGTNEVQRMVIAKLLACMRAPSSRRRRRALFAPGRRSASAAAAAPTSPAGTASALFGLGLAVDGPRARRAARPIGGRRSLAAHMRSTSLIGDAAIALMVRRRARAAARVPPPARRARPVARAAASALSHCSCGRASRSALWAANLAVWHVPYLYDLALRHRTCTTSSTRAGSSPACSCGRCSIDPGSHRRLTVGGRIALAAAMFAAGQVLTDVLVFSFHPLYPAYPARTGSPRSPTSSWPAS